MSLVKCLLRQVNRVLAENHSAIAKAIEIEVGPLSGVEPELIQSAFDKCASETQWSTTKLIIRKSSLVVECLQCQAITRLNSFVFRCKPCGSGSVKVIAGDEFRLLTVTIDEPEIQPMENVSHQDSAHV